MPERDSEGDAGILDKASKERLRTRGQLPDSLVLHVAKGARVDLRKSSTSRRKTSKRLDTPIPMFAWCHRFSSTKTMICSPVTVSMMMISSPERRVSESMAVPFASGWRAKN